MAECLQEYLDSKFGSGIDVKLFVPLKTSTTAAAVQCIACHKVVSPRAMFCSQCSNFCCSECFENKVYQIPCGCADQIPQPIQDIATGRIEVEGKDIFPYFQNLTFKCVCVSKNQCKGRMSYLEVYKLGDFKKKVSLQHNCQFLPYKCLLCND